MSDNIRKLATIVALDVAGYSARTEADEARTSAEMAALRKVIEPCEISQGPLQLQFRPRGNLQSCR